MMEVKVGGRHSRRPVSESSMRFRRGSNEANPSSPTVFGAWTSQGLVSADIHRCREASTLTACLSHTFGCFCLRHISDSTWLSGKGQRRERWHSEGNPQWERMEDEERRNVKSESFIMLETHTSFFGAFSSFGHDTMWYGSPWAGVWLTRDVLPFRCFPSKSPLRCSLASTEEMFALKRVPNSAGVRTRCQAGGRKEGKENEINKWNFCAVAARYRSWDAKPQREEKQVWTAHEGRTEADRGTWDVCKTFVSSLLWFTSLNHPGALFSAVLNWSQLL